MTNPDNKPDTSKNGKGIMSDINSGDKKKTNEGQKQGSSKTNDDDAVLADVNGDANSTPDQD